nr:hypothetical protein [Tanacetum cinerariifolium]
MMSSLFVTNNFKKVMNEGGVVTEEKEAIELQPQKKGTKLSDFIARKKIQRPLASQRFFSFLISKFLKIKLVPAISYFPLEFENKIHRERLDELYKAKNMKILKNVDVPS